jgi:hypothetical protein
MFENRPEYNTPEYKQFRYSVFARDKWTCQLCLTPGKEIEAHHVIKWSVAPHLRYTQSNGITLCSDCHNIVTGREEQYQEQFQRIIVQKKMNSQMERGRPKKSDAFKKRIEAARKWRPTNPRLRF